MSSASSIAPDVTGNQQITDIVLDPTDATGNTLLMLGAPARGGNGGVFRTVNALASPPASVVFAQTFSPAAVSIRGTFALTQAGGPLVMYAATGEVATGTLLHDGIGRDPQVD